MGPPQSTISDHSACLADAHGCPKCPHPTDGPAIKGSPDVFVNSEPALRAGDQGIHSGAMCCGPNAWIAINGADFVLINGKKAVRQGDMTRHCGGVGEITSGSKNVYTG